MDIALFIQEEYILQTIVVIFFCTCFLFWALCELVSNVVYSFKKKNIDEITKQKLKKIGKYAYNYFFTGDKEAAKKKTICYLKEVCNKNLVNEKYDLIKRA